MAATPRTVDPLYSARGKVAHAVSSKDPEREYAARQELNAARLERTIRRALDDAPPLTDEARSALAQLLMTGGR